MHPQFIFNLFGIEYVVVSYSLFALLGAIVGIIVALPLLKREGGSYRKSIILLGLMAVSFLIGARLLNFFVNPKGYGVYLHLYSLRLAGLSVYGGIIGAFCNLVLWCKFVKIPIAPMLDALVIPSGPAFVLARIGCFLNGCCGGKVTSSCLGVVFPTKASANQVISKLVPFLGKMEVAVFPTQLFEASLALLGLLPVIWLYLLKKNKKVNGAYFLFYAIWFSGMRLVILPFRELPYSALIITVFYPLLYIGVIIIGVILLTKLQKGNR
jgi:phosphatidylglycerol---prolipoprotein diacylglyceryl transferase